MLAVLRTSAAYRLEPGRAAGLLPAGLGDRVPDLVVIGDRVHGFLGRPTLGSTASQQCRVEDGFLGLRVGLQPSSERLPDCRQFARTVGIVQPGELAAEPLVVVHDQRRYISHTAHSARQAAGSPAAGAVQAGPTASMW